MAVKARTTITVTVERDIQAVYWFYLLQSSTAYAPVKPTISPSTLVANSNWTMSEPAYTEGSTNSLYIVEGTIFTDGTWAYSEVSLSSSYEAAKLAYNKAVTAGQAAAEADDTANNTASDLSENYYTKTDMDSSLELVDGVIMGKVEATYVSNDSLKNAKDALNKAIDDAESDLSDRLDVAKNDLADTSDKFAEFKRTVEGMLTFDLDANGVPTLAIQAIVDGIAAAYAMKIHNSGYSVEYEGAKVGYMEKHNFAIPFAKVKEVQFAEQGSDGALGTASAVWVRRSNGHLTLKNLGG